MFVINKPSSCSGSGDECHATTKLQNKQRWAFSSEKGRGPPAWGFESEFQIHEFGIVPNF